MDIIGIDLGTTNSCIAIYLDEKIVIIPNEFGSRTTPSCVSIKDSIIVGQEAKKKKGCITDIKRLIGKKYVENNSVSYKIADNGGYSAVEVSGKIYTPEEISSFILLYLKDVAEKYLGREIKKAVVTVPAYFSDSQRKATKDAGTIVGLDIVSIINEPTAGALAYGYQNKTMNKNVLVYDLGGGTFDVTILHINDGIYDVLSTTGDTSLGGSDFTNNLFNYLTSKTTISMNECDIIKQQLSQKKSVLFNSIEITRELFDSLNQHLFDKTIDEIKKAIEYAHIKKEDIDEIILIGGATRMLKVQEMLMEYFSGKPLCKTINPDEAVAYGAGIYGAMLSGKINNNLLLDVIPLSLGIETSGGLMCPLLPKCSKKPNKKTNIFTTNTDDQTEIEIKIFEGEGCFTKDCILLGSFILENIPKMEKGKPKVNVTFSIDVDGILSVNAEIDNNNKQITVSSNNSISKEEMNRMIENAKKNKERDTVEKERIQAKIKLEALLHEMKKKKLLLNVVKEKNKWLEENSFASAKLIEQQIEEIKKLCI